MIGSGKVTNDCGRREPWNYGAAAVKSENMHRDLSETPISIGMIRIQIRRLA
jgi:hypothetical protein